MGKPTQARLLELFEDINDTVKRRISHGKALAGQEIRSTGNHGYYRVRVDGEYYLVHQILWRMRTGEWPVRLDHRDGNTLDNSPGNLREATHAQNMQNAKKFKNNTSGHRGVSWHKPSGKWVVQTNLDGKPYYGGLFTTFKDACSHADSQRLRMHGEYARGVGYRQEN